MATMRSLAVSVAVLVGLASACGKTRRAGPAVAWYRTVDAACSAAGAEHKPLLVLYGASWDTATAELDRRTFADPEVRALLHERFVALRLDRSNVYMNGDPDLADPAVREALAAERRFEPFAGKYSTTLILAPDCRARLAGFYGFVEPRDLADSLSAVR